jgi:outer membrane beta-barrel protein
MWKTIITLAVASGSSFCLASPKIERKLVALNKTEITEPTPNIVQNRFFTKQMRLESGASFGTVLNESYSKTQVTGARVGFFLSEKIGLEYNFVQFRSSDSPDLLALRSQEVCIDLQCRSLEPHFIRLGRMHQGQIVAAPVYGKINLFDSAIIYSDLTFSLGAAQVNTSQGSKWAFTPGFGQRFYFTKSMSLRLDVTDVFLKETISGSKVDIENWRHNWVAQAGLSVFLNGQEP